MESTLTLLCLLLLWVVFADSEVEMPKPTKPLDCRCQWPEVSNRNMSGHAPDCPAHLRWMMEFEAERRKHTPAPQPEYQI